MGKRVVFMSRVSKTGDKYYLVIPRKLHPSVEHGKLYIVTLEEVEQK